MLLTFTDDGPAGIDDDDDDDNDDFGGGMDDDLFSKFGLHISTYTCGGITVLAVEHGGSESKTIHWCKCGSKTIHRCKCGSKTIHRCKCGSKTIHRCSASVVALTTDGYGTIVALLTYVMLAGRSQN